MLFSMLLLALTGLMTGVGAQSSTPTYSYTVSANNPLASPAAVNQWCLAQTNSCRMICGGTTANNTCIRETLQYNCTCPDGQQPDMSKYNDTLLYNECQAYKQDCVSANPTDARAQQSCISIGCGGMEPTAVVSSSSSSSSGSDSTTMGGGATSAVAASSSAPASSAVAMLHGLNEPYLLVGGLVAGLMFLGGVAL